MLEAKTPSPSRLCIAGEILLLALFFGLATGFAEVAFSLFRHHALGQFAWTGRYHVWMAPAAYALLFLLPGLALALVVAVLPGRMPRRLPLYFFAFASAFIFTISLAVLHSLAMLILAAGVAVQIGRMVAAQPLRFDRLVRRGTPLLLALVGTLAVGMPLLDAAIERVRLARLPAAAEGAPNVLLIILDTVRAKSMSLYGHGQPTTPNLERWAERGVVYERAISTSSWTLPAHASIFTGRWTHELGVDFLTPMDRRYPTLAEVLQSHGYATGGFTANSNYTAYDSGLDRGFLRYKDHRVNRLEFVFSPFFMRTPFMLALLLGSPKGAFLALARFNFGGTIRFGGHRKPAHVVSQEFLDWVTHLPQDRPFFAFLNYFDAHDPYRCRRQYREQFACKKSRSNAYEGAIAGVDAELDRMLRQLEERGLLENTLVIVTSDHGEHFGEHGLWKHARSLYLPVLHVPLVLWWPGQLAAGVRVAEPVSVRDIPATVTHLLGIDEAAAPLPGNPLVRRPPADPRLTMTGGNQAGGIEVPAEPLFSQIVSNPFRKHTLSSKARIAVVAEGKHYILNDRGEEELYALDESSLNYLLGAAGEEGALLMRLRAAVLPLVQAQNGPVLWDSPAQRTAAAPLARQVGGGQQ